MKILFAVRGLFPDFIGGSHRHSKKLIQYLAGKSDIQIDVVHPGSAGHFADCPNVCEVRVPYGRSIFNYSQNIVRFLDVSGRSYDLAYSDGASLWLYLKKSSFPIVYNQHGYHFAQERFFWDEVLHTPGRAIRSLIGDWVRNRIAHYCAENADFVISECGPVTDILKTRYGCDQSKIIEIPVAVDPLLASPAPATEKMSDSFLFVGTLEYRKGVTYLVEAFRELDGRATLYVVGDGYLRPRLEGDSARGSVHFLGRVSDEELRSWYGKVEAFAFSGLAESGPIVVLEAMSRGLPIISTEVGAVPWMIDGNGFMVPPGDEMALRRAITRFLKLDQSTKREMGEKSVEIVSKRFSWDVVGDRYYEEFARIAGKSGG